MYQDARRTWADWLGRADVLPKVPSSWMCHKTPDYRRAAAITLRRYTHALPGELDRAASCRWLLAERAQGWLLAERAQEAVG